MPFSLVHLVKPTTQKEPAPLLLMLHGYGANEYDLIGLADALDPRFTVMSVRAPLSLGNGGYAWFPLAFTDEGIKVLDTKSAIESRALILKFLDEAVAAYPIDPKQIFLMGFSQGGSMAYSIALTEPHRLKGMVAMSSRLPDERLLKLASVEQLKHFPIFVSHGLDDQILPIQNGRESEARLRELHMNVTYKEYPMAHQISPECLSDISSWLTEQLNHFSHN
ncbi:MAG: alpha/beta hydrolase [Chloroherpetonaceae bacterium]